MIYVREITVADVRRSDVYFLAVDMGMLYEQVTENGESFKLQLFATDREIIIKPGETTGVNHKGRPVTLVK